MKYLIFVLLLIAVVAVAGCVGVSQTIVTPTAAATIAPTAVRTVPPLPTRIVITGTAPQPTTPQATATSPAPTATSPSPTGAPTAGGGVVISDPELVKLVDEAKADLTTRAKVSPDAITVVSAEPVEWRDSSLGCPMPGQMYAQVITPGYLIVLEANGETYNYHASMHTVMWCEK